MADYNVRYRDTSGKLYDNVQSQDEYGRYLDAGGAVGAGALAQPDQASAQDLPDWLKF